jgi:hypothetical protein
MNSRDIKLFGMSNQMLERDLDAIERKMQVELGREPKNEPARDQEYYPQFKESIRHEAAAMAEQYEIFYCLEKSIRDLIREKLSAEKAVTWWDTAVPPQIRNNAATNMKRELDSGVTIRSTEMIDYTTFGELGEIVRTNWITFSDTFGSQKAFDKIMTSLNILRGPIAHCCPLAKDEVVRLGLTLKDWFRLME